MPRPPRCRRICGAELLKLCLGFFVSLRKPIVPDGVILLVLAVCEFSAMQRFVGSVTTLISSSRLSISASIPVQSVSVVCYMPEQPKSPISSGFRV